MFHWNLKSDDLPQSLRHCAAAVGNFDGVHLGHAEILRRLKSFGLPTVVFTFAEHPRQILRPEEAPDLLTANERKAELIREQGLAQFNGYYMTNAVNKSGYHLYVEYASGEMLTISADGDPGDTCVFALTPLLDYAAKQDIQFY